MKDPSSTHSELIEEISFLKQRIKELEQSESELKRNELRFRNLSEASLEAIVFIENGIIADANKALNRLFGYEGEDIRGRPATDFIVPEKRFLTNERMLAHIEGVYETLGLRKDGSTFPIEVNPHEFEHGGKKIRISAVRDITDRKQAEEELNSNYALLQIAGETAHFGGWSVDLVNNKCTWSDAVADIHEVPRGYAPPVEEGIGFYAPEWRERITQVFSACAEDGIPYDEDMEIITQKGKRVWVRTIGKAVRNKDGKIIKVQGSFQDITEHKRVEEELRESELLLTDVGRMAKVGGWKLDVATGKVYWTTEVYRIHDIPEDKNHDLSRAITFFDMPGRTILEAAVQRCVETGESYDLVLAFTSAKGRHLWTRTIGHAVQQDGKTIELIGTFQDITEHKRMEEALQASEERLDLAMAVKNEGIWDWNLVSNEAIFDDRYYTMAGYTPGEFPQDFAAWADHVHPDDLPGCNAAIKAYLSGQTERFDIEFRFKHKSASWIWIQGRGKIVERDEAGAPLRIIGTHTDITDRKQAEEEIRNQKEFLRKVIDTIPAFVCVKKIDGSYELANKALCDAYGTDPEGLEGHKDIEFSPLDEEVEAFLQDDINVISNKRMLYIPEEKITYADGSVHWLSTIKTPLTEKDGSCDKLLAIAMDITERKLAEDELRESKEQIETLSNNIPRGMVYRLMVDPDGNRRFIYVSAGVEQMHGITQTEVLNNSNLLYDQYLDEDKRKMIEAEESAFATLNTFLYEGRYCNTEGEIRWSVLQSALKKMPDGSIVCDGVELDITDRKRVEEQLKESEDRFSRAIAGTGAGLWDWDIVNDRVYFSQQWKTMLGYEDHEVEDNFSGWKNLWHPEDAARIEKAVNDYLHGRTSVYEIEHRLRHKDGSWHWILTRGDIEKDAAGKPVRWTGTNIDVTERKLAEAEREKLQTQLTQAQKMESVGRLAGGVAHDFNNMLGVILGHTELAILKIGSDESLYADLDEIRKAAERSSDLTRQLLAFARKQTVAPKVLDLNEKVEGMLQMLRRLIGEDIDLAWLPGAHLGPVFIDPSQVDQVLANLCVNARDAITGTGRITIETNNIVFDDEYCARHTGFEPGEYILLAVSDDGCGMDSETQSRLFEPFFTTKEMGKGTGLGLATTYGIVKQNNGFMNVYSELGCGTTFRIYLPRRAASAVPRTEREQAPNPTPGNETILLVEDEPAILNMTTLMLKGMGYAVIATGTPGEAIRLAREHKGQINLLMTDVVMPEMNGRDLARNLMSIYPDMKRLFMSGYTANVIAHHGVLDEGVHFIQKPFSIKDLAAKIRGALDRE